MSEEGQLSTVFHELAKDSPPDDPAFFAFLIVRISKIAKDQ